MDEIVEYELDFVYDTGINEVFSTGETTDDEFFTFLSNMEYILDSGSKETIIMFDNTEIDSSKVVDVKVSQVN
ncbi:hypothetical protein [Metabacillus fastidiosus]|uniref:hypothetical protein n=1 Tax=Metabacillus fastidiosus TaxID=1458 RepID=UPI003D285F41